MSKIAIIRVDNDWEFEEAYTIDSNINNLSN